MHYWRTSRTLKGLVVSALLATLLVACGGRSGEESEASPGVTDDTIRFGGSVPLSGPASNFATLARSFQAYFRYVNEEQGGVLMGDGKRRKIEYTVYDDGYNPPRTVENTNRLVQQDQVFGIFGNTGTPTNTAVWEALNQQGVPHTFLYTGATKWGADPGKHPWSMGWILAYASESVMWVDYAKAVKPNGKAAILYQNDDFGLDYVNVIEDELKKTGITVVAKQSYQTTDPSLDQQVTNLAQSNADIWFDVSTGKFGAQGIKKAAELGWKPLTFLHSPVANIETAFRPAGLEASKGIVAAKYFKEPSNPLYANDPAVATFKERAAKYGENLNPVDPVNVSGFLMAENLVKVLEKTEKPTREAFMEALRSQKDIELELLLPGVKINTSADDGFPIESAMLQRFNGTSFEPASDMLSFEGKTPTEKAPGV